jgi:hypothetical protein
MERLPEKDNENDTTHILATGTPSIHFVHNYYPLALDDGGQLAPMAVDFVDRLAILVAVRRFPSMGAPVRQALALYGMTVARMKEFVLRSTYVPFCRFLGDVRCEFMQRLSLALHGTLGYFVSMMPCKRVVQLSLHAPRPYAFVSVFFSLL